MAIIENHDKKFIVKVYDPNGTYKKLMTDKDFSSPLNFSITVNGGLSPMELLLTKSFDEWTVSTGSIHDLELGDVCKFIVFDKENPDGIQVYSGILGGLNIKLNQGVEEVILQFLPNTIKLSRTVLRDTDNETTTKTFDNVDPSDIFRYIIYHSGSNITYNAGTIYDTLLARTYTFVGKNNFQALTDTVSLMPNGWYWYIGGDDKAYLANYEAGAPDYSLFDDAVWDTDVWDFSATESEVVIHNLWYKKQIKSVEMNKNIIELTNRILFVGGGTPQLYEQYETTSSVSAYGKYEEYINDEAIIDTDGAENKATRYLSLRYLPKTTYIIDVIDSNYSEGGYDIESFRVGDKVKINTDRADESYTKWGEFYWGESYWKYNVNALFGLTQYIKKINYTLTGAILELQLEPDAFIERVENINKDFQSFRNTDIPDVPTNI